MFIPNYNMPTEKGNYAVFEIIQTAKSKGLSKEDVHESLRQLTEQGGEYSLANSAEVLLAVDAELGFQ
jgi:hypothetical protein